MWSSSSSASAFSLISVSPHDRTTRKLLFLNPIKVRRPSFSLSLSSSWASPDPTTHGYGGWDISQPPLQNNHKDFPVFLLVGIGTSIVTLFAVISQCSLSRRGLSVRLSSPLHSLHGVLRPSESEKSVEIETSANDAFFGDAKDSEVPMELEKKYSKKQGLGIGRILIPTALDSTQQDALSILRRLKIIEEDIKADELCTRREYARWLVRANSLLERNPKHRILSPAAVSGPISAAFDDIHVKDPDFEAIQSLAEAGIVRSRLAGENFRSSLDDTAYDENIFFSPERFLSRQDLIDWKAQLEYESVLGMNEKISGSNLGFIDVRKINTDASPEFFVDMLAGDKSILRRVFGQGKRFQPNKPATKAQAAVALISGRMAEAIKAEIARLDAENISRKREMEAIKFEILEKGDIKKLWDNKMEEEKTRASEVERVYFVAMRDLEQENISQEKALAEYTKQSAAMDCQRQLLLCLKKEVDEMSKRLTVEKVEYENEKRIVNGMLGDSQDKLEKAHDKKSVLEAEIESLRIMRSWIEDEAKKSQARVKILEDVGRRWKWDDRT